MGFRCRRFRAIPAIGARAMVLCLCPSATTPTPHRALLKAKVKVQFERPFKRLSKSFFSVFQGSNPGQFQVTFSVFTVRSAEGRGLFSFTQFPNYPFTQFCRDTKETRQSGRLLLSKSFLEDCHTLRRCQSITPFIRLFNRELGQGRYPSVCGSPARQTYLCCVRTAKAHSG